MAFKKERRIGTADNRRHYDLPLQQDEGTFFLGLLIALMAFLATIALTFSFSINQIMAGWTQGLKNQVTIEIPAESQSGEIRDADDISTLQDDITKALENKDYVISINVVQKQSLSDMISPWLGDISNFDNIPMPGLVSVELNPTAEDRLEHLTKAMAELSTDIMVDTHASWLADLSRLTGSLQVAILFIVTVIGFTSVAAVAGAIKSQIEINRPDVELLHLMGAHDSYITKQFLRHAAFISFLGAVIGMAFGLLVIMGLGLFFDYQNYSLLPRFEFTGQHLFLFATLPVFICFISSFSARQTVLRVLSRMP